MTPPTHQQEARYPDPLRLMRRTYRRRRLMVPLWSLALALLAMAVSHATFGGPSPLGPGIGFALACASALLLAFWLVRLHRLTMTATVRSLDKRWGLSARMESAWEMSGQDSDVARAQRIELARRIASRRPPHAAAWGAGITLLVAAGVLNATRWISEPSPPQRYGATSVEGIGAAQAHPDVAAFPTPPETLAAGVGANRATSEQSAKKDEPPSSPPTQAAPEAEDATARIRWMDPTREIRATRLDTVPLTAWVTTRSGLHDVTLELAVNGVPCPSLPVPPEVSNQLCIVGDSKVQLEIHLDELQLRPSDVVSYHLKAGRNSSVPVSQAVSPVQFIEIKNTKKQRLARPEMPGVINPFTTGLFVILNTQVEILKDNFALLHGDQPVAPDLVDARMALIERQRSMLASATKFADFVAREAEKAAAKRMDAAGESFARPAWAMDAASGSPAARAGMNLEEVAFDSSLQANVSSSGQLAQARIEPGAMPPLPKSLERNFPRVLGPMNFALDALLSDDEAGAFAAGQQALKWLIACKEDLLQTNPEEFVDRSKPRDVFADETKKDGVRADSPAGKLEELAIRQGALNQILGEYSQDYASTNNDERATELTDIQGKLAHDIRSLAESGRLNEAAQPLTTNASKSSLESVESLSKRDMSRALARAAETSRSLQEAIRAQDQAGRAEAAAQLEGSRQELIESRRMDSQAEKDAVLKRLSEELQAAAMNQLTQGSEKAAMSLADVAAALEKLAGPAGASEDGWEAAERKAAAAQIQLGTMTAAMDRVARHLRRARDGLAGGGRSEASKSPGGERQETGEKPSESGRRSLTDLELTTQMAAALLGGSEPDRDIIRALETEIGATYRGQGNTARLLAAIEAVETAMTRGAAAGRRDERVRKYRADEVDPAYRSAIEAYFGKLSEETTLR